MRYAIITDRDGDHSGRRARGSNRSWGGICEGSESRTGEASSLKPTGKRIVVTGSVAFDYLMTFPGKFTEHLIPDRMSRLSVSFLVDEMRRVPGGCGPNIAYGLALLGERPALLATAGKDAEEYREKLGREGVDVEWLAHPAGPLHGVVLRARRTRTRTSSPPSTREPWRARDGSRSRTSEPRPSRSSSSRPTTRPRWRAYAEDCRAAGIPFLYDPSQQVTRLSGEEMREGFRGAAILIVNDYEFGILSHKTGLSREQMEGEVPVLIVTHGPDGSTIHAPDGKGGRATHVIPAAKIETEAVDPTGVGDVYRAGLLRGLRIGAAWPVAGRIGSVAAVFGLEALGPQPPRYSREQFVERYGRNFGDAPELGRLFG